MDKKIKILLIGGTGVLSTDIRELSIAKGFEVYILNRGKSKNKNQNENVKVIVGDIRDIQGCKEKIKDMYFDVVIDFLSFNVEQLKGTMEIFKNKCKQFIFISSATVYRKTEKGEKITESHELENLDWDYAQNKIECEKYLKNNAEKYRYIYTIVRPYVTYSDTRIPFAVIPHDKQWSIPYRILSNKPVVLWDNGKATCTLTYAKDFAVGVVGLFNNPKAFDNDFHITTDYTLTWNEALKDIGKALNKEVIIASLESKEISKAMPKYRGILYGDKGLDREFDNTKIKDAVPEFNAQTTFEEGIKHTIDFYQKNAFMREVDYEWDARIDNMIQHFYKINGIDYKNLNLKYAGTEKLSKNKLVYMMSRYNFSYMIFKGLKKIYKFLSRLV